MIVARQIQIGFREVPSSVAIRAPFGIPNVLRLLVLP